MLIDVSQRGEQGGADSFTHRRSEKPDEIGQWRNATEVCAPHAYSVLMNVSPDFVAPRNLAIFDDALGERGGPGTAAETSATGRKGGGRSAGPSRQGRWVRAGGSASRVRALAEAETEAGGPCAMRTPGG